MSPPGTSSRPAAEEHLGLHEVCVKYDIFKVALSGPPDDEFAIQDPPLTMLQKT